MKISIVHGDHRTHYQTHGENFNMHCPSPSMSILQQSSGMMPKEADEHLDDDDDGAADCNFDEFAEETYRRK